MSEVLPAELQGIVAEEEALLERVRERLAREPAAHATSDRAALIEQLEALRDEALTASARDLPALFQQMYTVRALAGRERSGDRPGLDTPYFAHLRLRDARGVRDYLLGRATFVDTAAGVRVVDWRYAPIARIFYRYQAGDDFEEQLPGGLTTGVVEARRVVVIERGRLTRIVDGTRVLVRGEDGAWTSQGGALGGGAGTAARPGSLGVGRGTTKREGRADISALLDSDQFDALSVDADQPLLVLGTAGSGKTTVALHRLAKLNFDDPRRFAAPALRVVVPEEGLARLSRRLLEPLGLGRAPVDTLEAWLYDTARTAFGLRTIKVVDDTPALVAALKRHPALLAPLVARVGRLDRAELAFHRLRRKLLDPFADPSFVTEVVDRAAGELSRATIDVTVRHTRAQLDTSLSQSLAGVDEERTRTIDGGSIADGTADALAGAVDAEDLALLLFLRARTERLAVEPIAHLVLDEAEDFSLFELELFGRLLAEPRSCTLAGDELQQTHTSFPGWDAALAAMRVSGASTCRLQVSYRCPRPVAELARQVLGTAAGEERAHAGRDGVPVGRFEFPDDAQAQLFVANALRDLVDREPEASIAVVAADEDAARAAYEALESLSQARLVLDGRFTFEPGIDVTDVDNVKGLEFDYVVVPDATRRAYPDDPDARRRLHVAITRASHQLWLVSSGARSPLLP